MRFGMAGPSDKSEGRLVPAIHDLLQERKTWMAVTSTAMTRFLR